MTPQTLAERNIHLLCAIDPDLPARLQAFLKERREKGLPDRFEFTQQPNGQLVCRATGLPVNDWIHGPDDPQTQAAGWIETHATGNESLFVVWQAGLGYVPRLLAQRRPGAHIIICESRYELFWEWLCVWDLDELLKTPCYLMIQDNPRHGLETLRGTHPSHFAEPFAVIPGSNLSADELRHIEEIARTLEPPTLTKRDVPREPKTMVFAPNSLEDMVPAVMRGAETNGYRAIFRTRSPGLRRFLTGRNLWRETCGCVPGYTLGFYGSVFTTEELIDMGQAGVKRAVWYYDNPRHQLRERVAECYDLALVFDPSHREPLEPAFGSRVKLVPLATGFDHFTPTGNVPPPPTPVTYIGATGLRQYIPILKSNPPLANSLLRTVRSIVSETLGRDVFVMQERLNQAATQYPHIASTEIVPILYQLATVDIRIRFLNAALPHGLTIYGDALWARREYAGNLTTAYAGTSLDYQTETPEVYAASPINLSICHPQLADSVPFRVYDTLACGGFLLTEYRPEIEKQFAIGQDLDVFRTPEELSEKIGYYLERESLRKEIARQGRATVLEKHTYRHRVTEIVRLLDNY